MNIAEHQLKRIDQLAKHHNIADIDIVAAMLMELGPEPTQGAVTSWLWEQLVEAKLEQRAIGSESPRSIAAWEAIEAGEAEAEPLTVAQVKAIVECGKPRGSSVKLEWGDQ
jgi:hypothetical protein